TVCRAGTGGRGAGGARGLVLLPRRADPERHRRTARAAAPEDLPPAGERPSGRGDPRADQLPLRGLPGAGNRAATTIWPEAGARDARPEYAADERAIRHWRGTVADGRTGARPAVSGGLR